MIKILTKLVVVYNYKTGDAKENYLELVFCISGNKYCQKNEGECNFCMSAQSHHCPEKVDTVDVASFRFNADHLSQFVKEIKTSSFSENILNFSHTSSFSKSLPLCSKTRTLNGLRKSFVCGTKWQPCFYLQ